MISVKTYTNGEKIVKNFKNEYKGWAIFFCILFIALTAFSISCLYVQLTWESGPFWFFAGISIIMVIVSIIPFFSVLKKYRIKKSLLLLNDEVFKSSISSEYIFEDYKITIKTTKNDKESIIDIPIKKICMVEYSKKHLTFFVEEGDCFKIDASDFLPNQKNELVMYFKKHMIKIKKC